MGTDKMDCFREVLATAMERSTREWVYLPRDREWSLDSMSATLESQEVPPELEDEPDAGVPELAKRYDLVQVVPVGTLQDIVLNAIQQKPGANADELFSAFVFYYNNDAFVEM